MDQQHTNLESRTDSFVDLTTLSSTLLPIENERRARLEVKRTGLVVRSRMHVLLTIVVQMTDRKTCERNCAMVCTRNLPAPAAKLPKGFEKLVSLINNIQKSNRVMSLLQRTL